MTTAVDTINPYLEAFNIVSDDPMAKWVHRRQMVKQYSWAIPNQEAVEAIVACGPIVEIGAGKGYWASLIEMAGGNIIAYDLAKRAKQFVDGDQPYFPIRSGGSYMATYHPKRALFLCWPSYDEPWAAKALEAYTGDTVIYVGEGHGGCCADDRFHQMLEDDWKLVKTVKIPRWEYINDQLMIYKRR